MHRLLVDQNVRIEVAEALRENGHEVVRPSETGVSRRDDEALFRLAIDKAFTILTFDLDFAERVYWNPEPHLGIVRLRLEPRTLTHVLPVVRAFLKTYPPEHLRNALVVLTKRKSTFAGSSLSRPPGEVAGASLPGSHSSPAF